MKRAAVVFTILLASVLSCRPFPALPGGEAGSTQQPAGEDLTGYFLPDPAVGMDRLQSYALSLSVSFSGTQDGKIKEFTNTYSQELNRETDTQFTYSAITNAEGNQEKIIDGNAGEAYYSKLGDEKCLVSWGARAEGVKPFLPTDLLPLIRDAHEAGSEEVNGVKAQRYDFDAASLGYPSSTKVEGQVWLAADGGYVVKFSMRIKGEDEYFGKGTKGEQTIEYKLDQVNALDGPDLPEGCQAVLTGFPAMPDAFDVQRLPQVLAYTSPSDIAQIQSFYEEQLQALGWTLSGSHPYPKDGSTQVFFHAEDAQIAHVVLQAAGTNTWVTVKVESMGETLPGMFP
jgi:hypothetical protein